MIKYISKKIIEYQTLLNKICTTPDTDIDIAHMLNNRYLCGVSMKKAECAFYKFISRNSEAFSRIHNLKLPILDSEDLFHKSLLVGDWKNGVIYSGNILENNVEIIIKTNRLTSFDTVIEYYISILINNLRYKIPNFSYFLGSYVENNRLFLIYEKIQSTTLSTLITTEQLTFKDLLILFVQILVALEVSQRDFEFTHFDLHCSNIMIKNTPTVITYEVPIDNITYIFKNINKLAVIIDFGTCHIKKDANIYANNEYIRYGFMPFMIQGIDMYKLLISILSEVIFKKYNEEIINEIYLLFQFFEEKDIFHLYKNRYNKSNYLTSLANYSQDISYSSLAQYTPQMFLKWILDKPKYTDILNLNLETKNRTEYLSLLCIPPIEPNCVIAQASYIMSMYINHIIKDPLLVKNKKNKIKIDQILLDTFINIEVPTITDFSSHPLSSMILNINTNRTEFTIGGSGAEMTQIIELLTLIQTCKKLLKPYEMMYYNILELNLQKIYNKFITNFIKSKQYKFLNSINISQFERWCITCKDANKIQITKNQRPV